MKRGSFFLFFCIFFAGCDFDSEYQFQLLKSSKTGITFNNKLTENDSINGLAFEYIYNGGGVGIGDFNKDGLDDIFFAGNMVSSELYLNKGNLKFQNITSLAGASTTRWCTGITVIDINDDGWKDIYISVAGIDTINQSRRNIFFINQGLDENGIPKFIDMAEEMGLADDGYSTMGAFFDYDRDGDLDLYLLTNSMDGVLRSMIRSVKKDGTGKSNDRLYRNNGSNRFSNVTSEAGILDEGYGLGVALVDINTDGWIDVYCANDFISNDLLYVNMQDGTFAEQSGHYFKHFSHNGMGVDIADINNDALQDVMVLDMLPADNKRQKLMLASNEMTFNESVTAGYHPQFLRNTLQLNRGKFMDGRYRFSEIGFLAGVHQTDWSWAPLIEDFDNDGWKDLLITNGFRKDVTNLDYISQIIEISRFGTKEANREVIAQAMENLPEVLIPNYIYRNRDGLQFDDVSEEWGLHHETFTNGTALADFDDDGDIDMIFNNLDMEATFYENRFINKRSKASSKYLNLKFDGSVKDSEKIGLKVYLYQGDEQQYYEYYPYRGYKSTMGEGIHFGLGHQTKVDSILLRWHDGTVNKLINPQPDTTIYLSKEKMVRLRGEPFNVQHENAAKVEFRDITNDLGIEFIHEAVDITDFNITPSLLRSLSHFGPSLSVGDINGDGIDDIFIGGDLRKPSSLLVQTQECKFVQSKFGTDSVFQDVGSLLFDADNDGDLDLYVVSGGYRFAEGHDYYQDRLYLNNGMGHFTKAAKALPKISSSGSCVVAADYDADGDLDLFVGGRIVGRSYPKTPQSYLLTNADGNFIDNSSLLGENIGKLGMVTSAIWSDVNNDHTPDLIVAGEWMPVTILLNIEGRFIDKTMEFNLKNSTGWWNSINGADFDNDGDIDYVLGNYGLNSFYKASPEKPLELCAKDFDRNGTWDPVVAHFSKDLQYIVHPLTELSEQIPGMRSRFRTYSEFGETTFENSFTKEELEAAIRLKAENLKTIIIENVGGETFEIHELPIDVQFSPVFGTIINDFNGDGLMDVIAVGNSYKEQTITGYYDASFGNVLINKGEFHFESMKPAASNFIADGDNRALTMIKLANQEKAILVSENDGALRAIAVDGKRVSRTFSVEHDDWYLSYDLGEESIKRELYYGHGFLSSTSRKFEIPMQVREIEVVKYNGESRKMQFQ